MVIWEKLLCELLCRVAQLFQRVSNKVSEVGLFIAGRSCKGMDFRASFETTKVGDCMTPVGGVDANYAELPRRVLEAF